MAKTNHTLDPNQDTTIETGILLLEDKPKNKTTNGVTGNVHLFLAYNG